MKTKLHVLLLISISLVLLASCKEDEPIQDDKDTTYVNNWIYDNMSVYYLWSDQMPTRWNLNLSQKPDDFFKSIVEKTNPNDRFSWIQSSYVDLMNALNGVSRDRGFEYTPTYLDASQSSVGFYVLYTKQNTTAANVLKRGDMIVEVGGVAINDTNYTSVFTQGKDNYTVTAIDIDSNARKTVTFSMNENYAENPIYFSKIYERGSGSKKIGYIVYNFFASDNGDNSYAYDKALVDKLSEFKMAGVDEFILDLRYNGGGSIISTQTLASALVPPGNTGKVFAKNKWNALMEQYIIEEIGTEALEYRFVDKVNNSYPIPNLGISKIYIIATQYSASASELIINGLKPYMDVELIGMQTVGKNVGSVTITDTGKSAESKRNKWGLQPIVMQVFNAAGESDYGDKGFIPGDNIAGIKINEFRSPFKPLGDENEILLSVALAKASGSPLPPIPTSIKSDNATSVIKGGSSLEQKLGALQMFGDNKIIENMKTKSLAE